LAAGWNNAEDAGQWTEVVRTFRDGHQERWWALEVVAGPYGTRRAQRALVATTDPQRLPRLGTWYLTTNLPAPSDRCEQQTHSSDLAPASVAEVVRLFGFRMWVEQSYKQVKHALGWSQYQVRSDLAIRRHWQLVCLAFSFCWWAYGRLPATLEEQAEGTQEDLPAESVEGEKRRPQGSWPEALRAVRGWLEPYVMLWRYWRAVTDLPPPQELRAPLERMFSGEGLYLYVH
jgi:hypothetical protein